MAVWPQKLGDSRPESLLFAFSPQHQALYCKEFCVLRVALHRWQQLYFAAGRQRMSLEIQVPIGQVSLHLCLLCVEAAHVPGLYRKKCQYSLSKPHCPIYCEVAPKSRLYTDHVSLYVGIGS